VQVTQSIDESKRTIGYQYFLFLDIDRDEFHVSWLRNIDRRFAIAEFSTTKDFPCEIQLIQHVDYKRFAF
jgi:hypothetical protein